MTISTDDPALQGRDFGSPAYRRYVLLSLAFVYTLNFIDRALLGVLAQPVITTFGLSDAEFGFLAGPPFALFYALMGIPIALAADRYNRVAIIAICIALWSLMTVLCGLATGFLFLLLARVGVAIGEAGSNPPSNSLIADYYRPDRRAKALSIYSTGVMLGSALAFLIGGPLGQLPDATVIGILGIFGLAWLPESFGWGSDFGWRFAFLALGVPGLLIGAIVWLTIREPPRGYSDPPGLTRATRIGIGETLRGLRAKPSFWLMAAASSLVAMVGYGFASFQSPMMQRLHGLTPAEFALRFGVPLSVAGALGTIAAGFITERLMRRSLRWLASLPAMLLVFAVPLYITAFLQPSDRLDLAFPIWMCASALHFSYLGAQYTIGQGVVPQSSRASAIAILLFIIALVGNGIGPQFVGALSDTFMMQAIEARGLTGVIDVAACNPKALGVLATAEQAVCVQIYGEGLRNSMIVTALLLLPAAVLFWLCAKRLDAELIAR